MGYRLAPLPPGSMGEPVIGDVRTYMKDPVGFLWERYHRHGRIFKTYLGKPTVFMIGPEANEFILHDRRDCFSVGKAWPNFLRFMLGEGAMSMKDGEAFLRMRSAIAPSFAAETLSRSFPSMQESVKVRLQDWTKAGLITFFPEVKALMNEVMCEWIMGISERLEERGKLQGLWQALTDVPEGRRDIPSGGDLPRPRPDSYTVEARSKLRAKFQLRRYLEGVVAERRKTPTLDAISLMCQARDKTNRRLTTSEIISQTLTLLTAGNDSTAATATWFLYAVGRHTAVLARLRSELEAVIGDGPFTWQHLKQLPYLTCVLKEVERVHPVALAPARVVERPFIFDGYRVPARWVVRYCILLSHFLPEVFADPEKFDPDRFAPPREEDRRTPYSLVGFGAGPRHCTGKPFALLFMQTLAVTALRHYDWSILPNQDLTPVLDNRTTFKPRSRLKVQFSAR
jgi:retinoid hydroxylase